MEVNLFPVIINCLTDLFRRGGYIFSHNCGNGNWKDQYKVKNNGPQNLFLIKFDKQMTAADVEKAFSERNLRPGTLSECFLLDQTYQSASFTRIIILGTHRESPGFYGPSFGYPWLSKYYFRRDVTVKWSTCKQSPYFPVSVHFLAAEK